MTFLNPLLLVAGIAALGLPLLIHWMTRPRPTPLPFSAVRFIMEVLQQRRARHRLRDLIILSLRLLAILLLAAALARPLLGLRPLVAATQEGDATRIVLLDASQSMAAVWHGVAAFDRARPVAARYLAADPSARTNLIIAAAHPRAVFERPSSNFAALREELSGAAVRPERLDVQAAINLAAQMLAPVGPADAHRKRELVIVSDFQRSNWVSVDFSQLPPDTLIQLESVAPAQTPPNLAVVRAAARGRAEQARPATIDVDVANFSPTARAVRVELTLGGAAYHLTGSCPAGGTATLSTDVTFASAGWVVGEARLIGAEDALAADDVRPLVIHVVSPPTYALVTRQSADQRPSSSFYLERALAPIEARQEHGASRVVRVDPERIDRETLAGTDLVVFDHPGRLSPDAINLLAAALRRGRPILYVAAESPDATNLKLLADACGSDLKMPVQFMPPAAGQLRHDLFLQEVNAKVPPFSVFGDGVTLIKSKTKFSGGLVSRRLPGGLGDDVLASFSDRTAALLVTPCGAGTLAVLNVDLESSTLPGSPAFVPLIGELVDRLSGQGAAAVTITSGDLVAIDLPPEAGTALGLKIVGPSSTASADFGQIVTEGSGAAWGWPIAGPPGVYQIKRNDATVFAAACVLPADEADLTPLDPELIRARLAAGRQLHFRSAQQEEESKDTHWTWLAVACAGCMLVELVALKMFRT